MRRRRRDKSMNERGWKWTGKLEINPDRVAGLSAYPGTYTFDIVGESFFQAELEEICGGKTPDGHHREERALLVPYENPHDDQAVGVLMGGDKLVGHLSRDDARAWRGAMIANGLEGCTLLVPAMIVGGWKWSNGNEGHFGVKLD